MEGENSYLQRSEEGENDLLGILQESDLYVELTPEEQHILLNHIAEFYHPLATPGHGKRAA